MCLILGGLVSRLLFFFFRLEMSISTHIINIGFMLYKAMILNQVEKWTILLQNRGTNLEPSSPKLGTCQSWNYVTLAYWAPFQNQPFQTCMASKSIRCALEYSFSYVAQHGVGISHATHPAWLTLHQHTTPNNEWGEPTTNYRWTNWSSSSLKKNHQLIWKNLWNIPQFNKVNPKDVNM
jgi:hypothetical protein